MVPVIFYHLNTSHLKKKTGFVNFKSSSPYLFLNDTAKVSRSKVKVIVFSPAISKKVEITSLHFFNGGNGGTGLSLGPENNPNSSIDLDASGGNGASFAAFNIRLKASDNSINYSKGGAASLKVAVRAFYSTEVI